MATYVMESDKQFLCCKDLRVVEVYAIDSLYIAPVQQKHWAHVATIHLGEGNEFEALQIGDREIIKGGDLERLIQDLMCLGMMINREGLCFLKTERNISEVNQVDYLRMFDLFDWSKYHVKSRLHTRWVRNDIVDGRPILESYIQVLSEKEAELKEMMELHMEELGELKRKHLTELAELKNLMEEELKVKQDELDRTHTKNKKIENKLTLHCYKKSESDDIADYFSKLVKYFQRSSCADTFVSRNVTDRSQRPREFYSPPIEYFSHLVLVPVGIGQNFPQIFLENTISCMSLDHEDWRHLEIEMVFTVRPPHELQFLGRSRKILLFYDGSREMESKDNGVTYPSPCFKEYPLDLEGWGVYHILGIGFRVGFIYIPDME